jgi:hypothetical protein
MVAAKKSNAQTRQRMFMVVGGFWLVVFSY